MLILKLQKTNSKNTMENKCRVEPRLVLNSIGIRGKSPDDLISGCSVLFAKADKGGLIRG